MKKAGFVVPEPLSLRNHYIKTLGIWAARLEQHKDEAIAAAGEESYNNYMRYLTGCQYYFVDEALDVSLVTYPSRARSPSRRLSDRPGPVRRTGRGGNTRFPLPTRRTRRCTTSHSCRAPSAT